jgi:hypothetical protein
MCVEAFDLEVWQREQPFDESFQLVESDALAVCSRFDFDMNASRCTSVLCARGESGRNIFSIDDLAKVSRNDVVQPFEFRVTEDGDRLVDPQISHSETLFEIVYTQPVGMPGGDRCNDIEAVTVRVSLYNRHHASTWSYDGTKRFEIFSDSGRIDFNPAQHRNILF